MGSLEGDCQITRSRQWDEVGIHPHLPVSSNRFEAVFASATMATLRWRRVSISASHFPKYPLCQCDVRHLTSAI